MKDSNRRDIDQKKHKQIKAAESKGKFKNQKIYQYLSHKRT